MPISFQATDSTVNQIIEIYNRIISYTDSGTYVRLLFCYVPKAFDKAWRMSYSLNQCGLCNKLFSWIGNNYADGNKQLSL